MEMVYPGHIIFTIDIADMRVTNGGNTGIPELKALIIINNK